MDLLLYLPAARASPCPCSWAELRREPDGRRRPGYTLGDFWVNEAKQPPGRTPGVRRPASGRSARILARGYGLATAYYCDIEPTSNGGCGSACDGRPGGGRMGRHRGLGLGTQRALDYLQTTPMWTPPAWPSWGIRASARRRCGRPPAIRASRSRSPTIPEPAARPWPTAGSREDTGSQHRFPHWFCENYKRFNGREEDLPSTSTCYWP